MPRARRRRVLRAGRARRARRRDERRAPSRIQRLRHALVAAEGRSTPKPDGAAAHSRSRSRVTPRAAKSSSHASISAANSGDPGRVPPSRIHSSAYDSGSSDSRSHNPCVERNSRRLDPLRARVRVPIPGVAALPVPEQLRDTAGRQMRARRPCTNAATRSSPCIPPSRYSYAGTPATRGVMTNGGFETMRSNSSPATGSNSDPRRVSMPLTPFSRAFSRVKRSARSDTSVATTSADIAASAKRLDAAPGPDVEPTLHAVWAAAERRA